MGLFDFLKRKPRAPEKQTSATSVWSRNNAGSSISYVDKERIMVERVTIEDMKKFATLPYMWNNKIQKFNIPGAHPFAYMELVGDNINVAKSELEKINILLADACQLSKLIPKQLSIPVNQIIFTRQENQGHTRLMCTPHTFTGKISKYPASLSFMTDISSNSNSSHGELLYLQNGSVGKANIYLWRRGCGYFLYYKTDNNALTLSKIDYFGKSNNTGKPTTIYKIPTSKSVK